MKKFMMMALAVAGLLTMPVLGHAESIWYKGWSDRYDYSKYATYQYTSIKADIGVWPVAYGHTAGAVYTDDGWATVNWVNAQWVANVPNAFGGQDEAWKVYLLGGNTCGQMGCGFTPFTFEFALYVRNAAGQTTWANNGGQNYRVSFSQ